MSLSAPVSPQASADDLEGCYRLYMSREPDEDGRSNWMRRVVEGITLDEMRYHFIASPEFHARPVEQKLAALAGLGEGSPRRFSLSDVMTVTAASYVEGFRDQVLTGAFELPESFDRTLAPEDPAFREQQLAFWRLITGRESYDPAKDEDTPEIAGLDVLNRPAFYMKGEAGFAGEQLMAMGHILQLSQLRAGARVLEYGGGFGQIALAFARLGIQVDTVDINPHFCAAVTALADRYGVDLTSHVGEFGDNPAGTPGAYDLIYFYESFHHCLDFKAVIGRLKAMLKPGGKIIMAGEPILTVPEPALPYPWGLRMDGENVIIMRSRGWMELGFMEDFLLKTFAEAGFTGVRHNLGGVRYATAYVFSPVS